MPNSTAYDIATYIVDSGLANFDPDDDSLPFITVGMEPDIKERSLITLYDTGGPASNPAYTRDYPRIQVRTKAANQYNYPSAYGPQQNIKDLILGMSRVVWNDTIYVSVTQQGDIASLSTDQNSRPVLISNYQIIREYDNPYNNRITIGDC